MSEGKKKEEKVDEKKNSHMLRHIIFFLIVLGFGIIVKKNPWILKDIMSVRIHRRRIASNQESDKVFRKLVPIFGERVSRDLEILKKYDRDRSHHPRGSPDMIVFPETIQEVQQIMRLCYRHNYIAIPMGFNSGLEGQSIAYQGGLIINMMKMKKILKLYENDLQITVEPGILISELNDELEKKGLFFPVIPASKPSIGGAVSTSGSGTTTFKYGTMKSNVVNLKVILPNGELITTASRASKSAAGFDLTSLFIGSEGTLGVIVEVTLKIHKISAAISACVVNFESLDKAAETVISLKAANIAGLARLEILNVEAIRAVNSNHGSTHIEKPHLFLEFEGNSEEEVGEYAKRAEAISTKLGGNGFEWTSDEEERKKLWMARNNAYFSCTKLRSKEECPGCRLFSTDVCVPMSNFAELIMKTEKDFVQKCKLRCPIVGHSGDGNFHVLTPINWDDEDEVARLKECNDRLILRAIEVDGTCTGEHGVGVGKKEHIIKEFGELTMKLMKQIKQSVDPKNIMNPGKIFSDRL